MKKDAKFEDLFQEGLEVLYDAEKQIVAALPKMIAASSWEELASAFESCEPTRFRWSWDLRPRREIAYPRLDRVRCRAQSALTSRISRPDSASHGCYGSRAAGRDSPRSSPSSRSRTSRRASLRSSRLGMPALKQTRIILRSRSACDGDSKDPRAASNYATARTLFRRTFPLPTLRPKRSRNFWQTSARMLTSDWWIECWIRQRMESVGGGIGLM